MKRRAFLQGAAAGAAIGVLDWLAFFRRFGVPGTAKTLGFAEAVGQTMAQTPNFLVYWFQEGGWDSYSMFGPIDTPNHATLSIPAGELNPTPSWSQQFYRPKAYGLDAVHAAPFTQGNLTAGYLAKDGSALFDDLAVVSSHMGSTFHSGGRWEYHYGKYASYAPLTAVRGPDERTVMQAFCEAKGSSYPLAHVSWHRWLADGELEESNYPEGTGYYEKLGPAYAHTIYGRTPVEMRDRLSSLGSVSSGARSARLRGFVDDLHQNFLKDRHGESVAAFSSAVQLYKQLTGSPGLTLDPSTLFKDAQLRADFNVQVADELTNATSVNGNPARSKDTPNINVQAMMAYELMTKGLSCGFWLENRQIRGFDTHASRASIRSNQGQTDQLANMKQNLWAPLTTFVAKLKNTQVGTTGKSYFDCTTIVLASEMGRTIQGDVSAILTGSGTDAAKYAAIQSQDCCQHWRVNSVAFLGGNVQGNRQYGRVGTTTLDAIPLMPDGTLDPAYDPVTGVLTGTKSPKSAITNAGHVYATALQLSGVDPTGKGLNAAPPLSYIQKA
jgi:hypothetical protein